MACPPPRAPLLAAVALVAVVALAGCSGAGEAGGPRPGADVSAGDPEGARSGLLSAPAWAVGDWWTYGIAGSGVDPGAPTTYVVTADLGTDWRMDTDSDERAFQDARDDISRLGAQRKSDLAGSQGSDRVQFFRFPIEANATWATRWDGQEVTIRVEGVDAEGARFTARNATHLVYTYTYDAASAWFGSLGRHALDGSVAFSLQLLDSGHAWSGEAVRYELRELYAGGADATILVDVTDGATDLWLEYAARCTGGAGGYTVVVKPADGTDPAAGHTASQQCTDNAFSGVVAEQPPAGNWLVSFTGGGQPDAAVFAMTFLQRTRTTVPVASVA